MANIRDFNASLNSSSCIFDTLEWNINTSTVGAPRATARHAVTQYSVIVKCGFLIPFSVIGILGNILILVAIRKTPRLWTKTNVCLASMAIADVLTSLTLVYYITYQLLVYISANPCLFIRLIAIVTPLQKFPIYVSCAHLALLALERYTAILHPFQYELWMTDTVIWMCVATAWVIPSLMSLLQMLWLLRVDWDSCNPPFSATVQFALSGSVYVIVSVVMVATYARIFGVVLRHRAKISAAATFAARQGIVADPRADDSTCATMDDNGPGLRKVSKKSEFKAAKMVAVVLASFIVLWFPYNLGNVFQTFVRNYSFASYLLDVGVALGSANNSINWIIYGAMSSDFRNAFKRLFSMR